MWRSYLLISRELSLMLFLQWLPGGSTNSQIASDCPTGSDPSGPYSREHLPPGSLQPPTRQVLVSHFSPPLSPMSPVFWGLCSQPNYSMLPGPLTAQPALDLGNLALTRHAGIGGRGAGGRHSQSLWIQNTAAKSAEDRPGFQAWLYH